LSKALLFVDLSNAHLGEGRGVHWWDTCEVILGLVFGTNAVTFLEKSGALLLLLLNEESFGVEDSASWSAFGTSRVVSEAKVVGNLVEL